MGAHKLHRLEASNHLGNVLTLFTDKKIPVGTGTTVSYYKADLVSSMDYSPFGAPLKGRTFNGSGSRYGFNGQEKDNEIAGAGNSMTAEFWQYDARLGRRWNIDPVVKPWMSSYHAFSDNPIIYIDPLGNTDFFWKGKFIGTDGNDNGLIAMVNSRGVKREIQKASKAGLNTQDYHLCSGDANAQFNVIHTDVLNASMNVLTKAISTKSDMVTEHSAVLKENEKGGFTQTFDNSTGKQITDDNGNTRVSGGTTPEGDVRIHSHPIGVTTDSKTGKTNYHDASQPSPCDPVVGGDMCADADYNLNVIVGKNGSPPSAVSVNGGPFVAPNDDRNLSINIFGSDSKLKFSVTRGLANKILGEKNIEKKAKLSKK